MKLRLLQRSKCANRFETFKTRTHEEVHEGHEGGNIRDLKLSALYLEFLPILPAAKRQYSAQRHGVRIDKSLTAMNGEDLNECISRI